MRIVGFSLSLGVVCLSVGGIAHASSCFDISRGEPKILVGELRYVLFPGPPNFEDVQRGDTPEPTYVLKLDRPICIRGEEFADPNLMFDEVQLVGSAETQPSLKANVRRYVRVALRDRMAANTGHHHEPLVAWVAGVTPNVKEMDFISEYGSPATTIRTFYETLGDGQGDVASTMVIPEKRKTGPFAAANLTRFYGQLKEPIRLLRIDQKGPNTFIAYYRYATPNMVCEGQGLVTTVARGGKNYIQGIRALNRC